MEARTPPLILVVEDESDIRSLVCQDLRQEGYETAWAEDGLHAMEILREKVPSLILLDLKLPHLDGWEVCRKVRLESRTREVPIVFLTALADVTSRVRGLAAGGDDYIVKPFSRRELVARVRAVLRRAGRSAPQSRIAAGNLLIDRDRHEVTVGGRPVLLTLIEFSLLACLAESPGRVFSRDELITLLWGVEAEIQEHNLDVHIHALRAKLHDSPRNPRHIVTVRGTGYKFRDLPAGDESLLSLEDSNGAAL
jgi:DNA-binding response OmpR family regulator